MYVSLDFQVSARFTFFSLLLQLNLFKVVYNWIVSGGRTRVSYPPGARQTQRGRGKVIPVVISLL